MRTSDRDSPGGVAVLGAVLLAVCCALPVLIGAGVAAVGLTLGSAVIVAAGLGFAVWGWHSQRKRRCGQPGGQTPQGRLGSPREG